MRQKNLPSFGQWKQIFKILEKTERKIFLTLLVLALASAGFLVFDLYIKNTKVSPAFGGSYTEAIVGQPRFINPIYGETNDIDRALIGLIYSGILTYDKNGNLVADLVSDYQISSDGKTYSFQLKDNLYWQDGVALTVDDIVYTIKTIQNSDYKSPERASWLDVEIQKISDKSFTLSLRAPYNSFLETCTVKIIPEHIWKNISPENFALSAYNLQPVGSGPYMFADIEQTNTGFIKSIALKANLKYYGKVPYIPDLSFKFSDTEQKNDGKFNMYSFALPRYFAVFFNTQKARIFSDSNISKALSYSVNKQELAENIKTNINTKVSVVDSPILPEYFGFSPPTASYEFSLEKATTLLDKSGYKDSGNGQRTKPNAKKPAFQFQSYLKIGSKGNEVIELQGCLAKLDESFKNTLQGETNGTFGTATDIAVTNFQKKYLPDTKPTGETGPATRKKLNELCLTPQDNSLPLKFTLLTIDQPQLVLTANLLKNYWQKVGATVEIKAVPLSELKQLIKQRDYDALLYGQALQSMPDLYPFWHSSQINDPGLNLPEYQNKDADQLLKEARETSDSAIKAQKYEELQDIIIKDAPALFLYSSDYAYWVPEKIKGIDTAKIIDPAKRFVNITNWYINTKRIWTLAN